MTDRQAVKELVKLGYSEEQAATLLAKSSSAKGIGSSDTPDPKRRKPREPRRPAPGIVSAIPPSEWTVRIPGWHPTWANKLIGGHWASGRKKKKADKETIALFVARCGIPVANSRRRLSVHYVIRRGKDPDPDAGDKVLRDALVECGALVDDNLDWIEPTQPTFSRGKAKSTFITLEDL